MARYLLIAVWHLRRSTQTTSLTAMRKLTGIWLDPNGYGGLAVMSVESKGSYLFLSQGKIVLFTTFLFEYGPFCYGLRALGHSSLSLVGPPIARYPCAGYLMLASSARRREYLFNT